ncbi:MAG: tripartite tricarboxylate transporter permease [Burkholderiales bacterium]|nr:tripartite tricarboxylate transporter permease [Burkholderiales bacterium]
MPDLLVHLGGGFAAVLQPTNLAVLAIGLVLGLLVAVLPGLTLVMGVVLALPFTYHMGLTPAVILLTAMYVSGTYGGAFTSILFRIPGEPIDVPLLWDGYAMARGGAPAKALGWTLFGALGGGLVAAVVLVLLSQPVARLALTFSAPEFFAIILFGLTSVVSLGGGSVSNALISLFIGLLIATVGTDETYGTERFVFGVRMLSDGIEYLLVMVGAYGLGEVFTRLEQGFGTSPLEAARGGSIRTELPRLRELMAIKATFARSSLIGILVGIVPGAGATIASFVSYGAEAQYGRRRRQLGSGIPEGILAPQTAATASVGGALIPLLTMGIPGSGATAIILAAFLLKGVQPGPQVFVTSGDTVYAIFAALFVAVLGMCLLGYFAIKLLVKVLAFPEAVVSAFVVMFCFIGALAARNNLADLYVITAFGILGYLFERFRFPIAPLVLGAILGPLAENAFMTTMISHDNDWTVLFTRPVAGVVMVLSIIAFAYPVLRRWRAR